MTDSARRVAPDETRTMPKRPWQTPHLEVLPVVATQNNGLVAPGDGTFSPSPSGS